MRRKHQPSQAKSCRARRADEDVEEHVFKTFLLASFLSLAVLTIIAGVVAR